VIVQLVVRFLLGGVIVSVFSVVGDVFEPKTFAGLFGAAPSIALTTLALAYAHGGAGEVATLGRSMMLGGVAFYVYGATCVAATKRKHWPVWLVAAGSWVAWFAVALGLWGAFEAAKVMP
jgi:hypothetical protein